LAERWLSAAVLALWLVAAAVAAAWSVATMRVE